MKKLVFIKVRIGDFFHGFETNLRISYPEINSVLEVDVDCYLSPNPEIPKLYEDWSEKYKSLRRNFRIKVKKTRLLIDTEKLLDDCQNAAKELRLGMQKWLNNSQDSRFQKLRDKINQRLEASDEIIVFLQTENEILKKLPWDEWDLFADTFTKAEIVLSPLEIDVVTTTNSRIGKNKVRILSILGDSQGIDIKYDRQLIANLPNAETEFLVEPNRQEFSDKLWEKDWDILFFAGHSESNSETGIIYINPQEKLPISELKNSLIKAIQKGLKLAIFNSCDGLKLAEYLAELKMPQVIVMRQPVPEKVAQQFLDSFLNAYVNNGESLHLAVRNARQKLEVLESEIPGATLLPIISQNSLKIPPTWQEIIHGNKPEPWQLSATISNKYYSEFPI